MVDQKNNPKTINYSDKTISETFDLTESGPNGLKTQTVQAKIFKLGLNVLPEATRRSKLKIFIDNFKSPLIYALLAAAFFAFLIGKYVDVGVIFLVLIINASIGYFQEIKAEKEIEALKALTKLTARVLRDGGLEEIDSSQLVPGDIVVLEEGDKIPADGRIIMAQNLLLNESSLTGESAMIYKTDRKQAITKSEVPLNMVFQGTVVGGGRGRFVVTATGSRTRFGQIATFAQTGNNKTPIQIKMEKLSLQIGLVVLGVSVFVVVLGFVLGRNLLEMVQLAVSLSVSAIPEGLPIAVTVILVMGAKRMARNNAIVRNMMAVETLGTTTVIATDKTGTLTHNNLRVVEIYANLPKNIERIDLDEHKKGGYPLNQDYDRLLWAGAVCNNAEYSNEAERLIGEPTDVAILAVSEKFQEQKSSWEISEEIPFSSEKKFMAVKVLDGKKFTTVVKGAPEEILSRCCYYQKNGLKKILTPAIRKSLEAEILAMSAEGLRIIAAAERKTEIKIANAVKSDLTFLGFMGLRDTYRTGVKDAIERCKKAGIRIIMLTGDHLITATSIAKKLGIITENKQAIIAEDTFFEGKKSAKTLGDTAVFARILPEHKYQIIELLKRNNEIVAMTGDGVNDVPALRRADIGIAMGVAGTDAAKEASDLILADDNFATIVKAVEEGRTIFQNIRKTLLYVVSTSVGEVFTVVGSLLFGLPLPITPLQILWINMITDTSATIPLGIEPKEGDQLSKPPRNPNEGIISSLIIRRSLLVGLYMGIIALMIFSTNLGLGIDHARTVTFLFLSVSQWFNAFNCRSECFSIFKGNPFSNKWLNLGIFIGFLAQLGVMYFPPLAQVFGFVPVNISAWIVALAASTGLIVVIEIDKLISNKLQK